MKKKLFSSGFTFIELLLVIALVLMISIPAAVFYTRFIYQMAVRDTSEGLEGMLKEAQALAMSGKENSSWGVKYDPPSIILFQGNSFSERNPAFDEIFSINQNVEISGFSETVFRVISGRPAEALPQVVVSHGNIQESFSLNPEGAVE
jgi:type II secretory pathway pseudopilin PulG